MSAEGLSHSLRWVRAKLADKQQSAHKKRLCSWRGTSLRTTAFELRHEVTQALTLTALAHGHSTLLP